MDSATRQRGPILVPKKSLGQHFLTSPRILGQVLRAADIGPQDIVLEVGPGLGHLTRMLAERAKRVVAVEVDERMVAALREQLGHYAGLHLVQGDILQLDIVSLMRDPDTHQVPPYKVAANIPYYITSALLRQILEAKPRPQIVVLMLQREVAQRIIARPGQMSLLAVSVQFFGRPVLVARIPAAAFRPAPKVDSAIVRIEPHAQLALDDALVPAFFQVVRAGFSQRRKQLRNSLAASLRMDLGLLEQSLERAGIDGRRRAQTLDIGEWVALYKELSALGHGEALTVEGADLTLGEGTGGFSSP